MYRCSRVDIRLKKKEEKRRRSAIAGPFWRKNVEELSLVLIIP
jgi:hypothetical protein